jgi:hypothetical protein
LKSNETDFKTFIDNAKLKFTNDTNNCRIADKEIILNNLFNLNSLNLNNNSVNYDNIYNIVNPIIQEYNKTFNIKYVPFYHKFDEYKIIFTKFELLNNFMNNDYNNINKINIEHNGGGGNFSITTNPKINKILVTDAIFTTTKINEYYNSITGDNNNYQIQRRKLYLYVFNDILNLNNKNIHDFLSSIKWQMYRYNKILYNALIQYGNTTIILNDITNFNDNLEYIISNNSNPKKNNKDKDKDTKNYNILEIINNYNDKLNSNDYLQTFQEVSNKYKNEWKIYNIGLYYYRILLFISIILFISIVIISNINIDDNTIILIFIIKILIILCLILFIYKKPKKEHFIAGNQNMNGQVAEAYLPTSPAPGVSGAGGLTEEEEKRNNIYNLYKLVITKYNLIVLSNKSNLVSSKFNDYISNSNLNLNADSTIINDFNEKLEYYKVKSIDLYNNIEILRNTNVINYYIILIIYVSFIFLIIGLICLILYPNNLYLIIISLSIIFSITLIMLFIKLHKNTNMVNDKNYWSNFNPTDNILYNDDGLT